MNLMSSSEQREVCIVLTERRIMVAVARADIIICWGLKILGITFVIATAAVILLAVLSRIIDRHKYNKILRNRRGGLPSKRLLR